MQGIKICMLVYIMQVHIDLSKHYPFICKKQAIQCDTNGKVFLILEKEKKKNNICLHSNARIKF